MTSTQFNAPHAHRTAHTPHPAFPRFTWLLSLLLLSTLAGTAWGQTPVAIADPNLEAAIRSALAKPTGELTAEDLGSLQELDAPYREISSLSGLEAATNLNFVNLEGNRIADASPLAGLTGLEVISLNENRLTTGAAFANLVNLHVLLLNDNDIQDVNWLAGLTQLTSLGLMFNPLGNCDVVAGLHNLSELYLNGTGISEVSFVSGLNNLTVLGLGDNNIRDGSPVGGLTGLRFLGLGGNQISNWDFMRRLTNLRTLYLFNDSISDVSFLSGLRNLTWLMLSENQIHDASPLAQLNNLQYLNLRWNQLSSSSALAGLTSLTNLDLSMNSLTEVNGLGALSSITWLSLANNQLQDASPLASLTSLSYLNVSQNRLAHLSFAQGLTALANLDASYNRLTDIQGLLGATSLSTATINNNLLFLANGSPSSNVIQTLESRGATVDASNQSLPYVATNGTYNGLFYVAGAARYTNSGSIILTTTAQRKYTGKLRLGKVTYALSGTLTADGTDSKTVQKGKLPPVNVDLVMRGADYLTGTVTPRGQIRTADMLGYRGVFNGKSSLSPQAGRYTLSLAGSNSPALPAGNGYGTFTVSAAGQLRSVGSLADGTKFTQSAVASASGQWPVYVPLYANHGSLVGWISLTNGPALGGDVSWSKPSAKSQRYTTGFDWVTQASVARYTPPAKGLNAFGLTACNLTLSLSGGDLKETLASEFTLNAKSQVKAAPAAGKLSLTFTPSTGLFKGRAIDPTTKKGVSFGGVIMQNQTNGCGYFLGSTTSGQVLLSQ
jgi:hypothetical protein